MKHCPSAIAALEKLNASTATEPELRVVFPEGTSVSKPGIKLPKLAAKDTPDLSLASALVKPHDGDKYIALCIDLDAPFTSFSFMGPIVHWLATDLVADQASAAGSFTPLTTETPHVMSYAGPGPPPGSAPHRYVFMVWEQPTAVASPDKVRDDLSLPAEPGLMARIRWDQIAFEQKMGLGEPLAVNYFVASSA